MLKINKGLNILKNIDRKNLITRSVVFVISVFFIALNYNVFMVKNQIVMGGMSGLAIIIKQLFGLSIPFFLNISTIVLFIISFIMLDLKKAIGTFLGGIFYNYMVVLTAPIASSINLEFQSTLLLLLVCSSIYGVFFGLAYRTGWNTGGSDAILMIMKEYLKVPMGLAGIWFNTAIVIFGLIVFGPTKTVYAVFILLLSNLITDNVTLGVKDSKMCFIKSKYNDEIENYLINNLNLGVTEIVSKGGVFTKRESMLLVIVPSDEYYGFKHLIKKFDNKAFILTNACYAVKGGYKKQLLPF